MRQRHAPNGSSITPYKPPSRNSAEAPKTVSDPNHVANKAVELSISGKLLPANMKSPEVFTLLDAQYPMKMVSSKYKTIDNSNTSVQGVDEHSLNLKIFQSFYGRMNRDYFIAFC
jgi:hypothetical protein